MVLRCLPHSRVARVGLALRESEGTMSEDDMESEDIVTEEMLWDRIPETSGLDRANTYYELSARIYSRGQYDEALALAETARDIYSELEPGSAADGLAQAYSAIGYNLNQLKRMGEAASAMSKAVELLRESKSPIAIELACTLGEWWFGSKEYEKTIECMRDWFFIGKDSVWECTEEGAKQYLPETALS